MVEQALAKGLGLRPDAVPTASSLGLTNQDVALDYLGRLPLRASEWPTFFQ